ncbi:hypothetical protein CBL_02850 [Carabus blaptoides fortunei]
MPLPSEAPRHLRNVIVRTEQSPPIHPGTHYCSTLPTKYTRPGTNGSESTATAVVYDSLESDSVCSVSRAPPVSEAAFYGTPFALCHVVRAGFRARTTAGWAHLFSANCLSRQQHAVPPYRLTAPQPAAESEVIERTVRLSWDQCIVVYPQ